MKTFLRVIFFLLLLSQSGIISNAQVASQVRLPQNVTQSALGCLACPGSEWNNTSYAETPDNQSATTSLAATGFCFQSTCSYSRALMANEFGFNIPSTAIISGIKVRIIRSADQSDAVRDSTVRLMINSIPVGANKKKGISWPTIAAQKTYGGAEDLWDYSWTPALINASSFGVWLKCYHYSNTTVAMGAVDVVRVIVYYTNMMKSYSQQAVWHSAVNELSVFPNPVTDEVRIQLCLEKNSGIDISIFNLEGKEVLKFREDCSAGIFSKELNCSSFPSGNYLVECKTNDSVFAGKFVKQ